MSGKLFLFSLLSMFVVVHVKCQSIVMNNSIGSPDMRFSKEKSVLKANTLIEQGRTFVHHALKRMAFLMPAIFFKLGIAFTLLVLVTIVAANNGVIGFMLLVVGLGSVLARLQESRHALSASPFVLPPSTHYQLLDRNDRVPAPTSASKPEVYPYTDIVYNRYSQ